MYAIHKFMSPCLATSCIDIHVPMNYNVLVRQRRHPLMKGSEELNEGMTNAQLDTLLEQLAKLIESKAKTVKEAAEIVRQAKTE